MKDSAIAKVTVDLEPAIYNRLLKVAKERHESVSTTLSEIIGSLVLTEVRTLRQAQIDRRRASSRKSRWLA